MSINVLDKGSGNPTYIFNTFWDFVVLCARVSPRSTFRAYIPAVLGWVVGASMGVVLIEKVTWVWVVAQASILVFLLIACTFVTYWSLRKEWDYMRSTNLVRKGARGVK